MKKLISILIIACMLMSAMGIMSVGAYTLPEGFDVSEAGAALDSVNGMVYGYVGDSDESYTVTIKDATLIQKHVAYIVELDNTGLWLSDVDFSGDITIRDATTIQKWVAGIPVDSPINSVLFEPGGVSLSGYEALCDVIFSYGDWYNDRMYGLLLTINEEVGYYVELFYDTEMDVITVWLTYTDTDFTYEMYIDIHDEEYTEYYIWDYDEYFDIGGYIFNESFNEDYNMSYDSGYTLIDADTTLELAKSSIRAALYELDTFLYEYDTGLSIEDIGFINFY